MKAMFEIEWNDDLGHKWMNKDNLQICIDSYVRSGLCKVIRECVEVDHNGGTWGQKAEGQ